MKNATVHAALREHLTRWTDLPAFVQWQGEATDGVETDPDTGKEVPWCREVYAPQAADPRTLGELATIRLTGVYFLDVFVPSRLGIGTAEELGDSLAAHFCPRSSISRDGLAVEILSASQTRAMESAPGWLQVPLMVNWRAHTLNPI